MELEISRLHLPNVNAFHSLLKRQERGQIALQDFDAEGLDRVRIDDKKEPSADD
ncbi:hypothetical protein N9L71_10390 [Verrucomicrobiales bacterium]|jgi:hypothetical protein|nr:hypothetical protein [Verrucomicrobiales bacterium]